MRAAEAYWQGRETLFLEIIDNGQPSCLSAAEWVAAAQMRSKPRQRDGLLLFRRDVIEEYAAKIGPFNTAWRDAMQMDAIATEATLKATGAVERLDAVVKGFASHVKNDLSSMKAASDRVQSEVIQMQEKYSQATTLLNSPEFENAIKNAERMATALEAISRLSETKLSVAVFSGGAQ